MQSKYEYQTTFEKSIYGVKRITFEDYTEIIDNLDDFLFDDQDSWRRFLKIKEIRDNICAEYPKLDQYSCQRVNELVENDALKRAKEIVKTYLIEQLEEAKKNDLEYTKIGGFDNLSNTKMTVLRVAKE